MQFLGGPLDGLTPMLGDKETTVVVDAGAVIHVYERGEMFYGPKVIQVMRHIKAVPLPRRKGK